MPWRIKRKHEALANRENNFPFRQSFLDRLEVATDEVLAARKDLRKKMLEREKSGKKPKPTTKSPKSTPSKKAKNNNAGLNKYGNTDNGTKSRAVVPDVLDENNQLIVPGDEANRYESQELVRPDDATEENSGAVFTKLRTLDKPRIFIGVFRNRQEDEKSFLDKTKSLLQTNFAQLFYVGDRQELEGVYVIFIAASKISMLEGIAKKIGAPYLIANVPEDFFILDSPFDTVDLKEINRALAGGDTKLRRELNEIMRRISESRGEGQVTALRMASEIPLDYARFLSPSHRAIEYYLGGHPPSAGAAGSQFILASEEEVRQFMKIVNEIKPPNAFFNDLFFVPDVNPEFKDFDPKKYTPPKALILKARTKFDAAENVTLTSAESKKLMTDNQKLTNDPGPIGIATQLEMLEAFVRVYMKKGNTTKPGQFRKRRYYTGNAWVHFNRNETVAILWGPRTGSLSLSKNKILKCLPFVKDVNLTFLK